MSEVSETVAQPKERPILFSAEMVRAILDNRKTQTRRVIKGQPLALLESVPLDLIDVHIDHVCPYGVPGDRLWVRETFAYGDTAPSDFETNRRVVMYRADPMHDEHPEIWTWHPSIFMPRWASRLTLEVTEVRVQRVAEISGGDVVAEGAYQPKPDDGTKGECVDLDYLREKFRALWDSINAKRGFGWDLNPWVWAITFRRVYR